MDEPGARLPRRVVQDAEATIRFVSRHIFCTRHLVGDVPPAHLPRAVDRANPVETVVRCRKVPCQRLHERLFRCGVQERHGLYGAAQRNRGLDFRQIAREVCNRAAAPSVARVEHHVRQFGCDECDVTPSLTKRRCALQACPGEGYPRVADAGEVQVVHRLEIGQHKRSSHIGGSELPILREVCDRLRDVVSDITLNRRAATVYTLPHRDESRAVEDHMFERCAVVEAAVLVGAAKCLEMRKAYHDICKT